VIPLHEREVRPGWKELGRFLLETGVMSPDWADSFERVDRSWFLPETIWPFDEETGRSRAVSATDDPDEWF
jgi:hypothetical protein